MGCPLRRFIASVAAKRVRSVFGPWEMAVTWVSSGQLMLSPTRTKRTHARVMCIESGAPGGIRTHDPCLRRAVLYPAELRAHVRPRGGWHSRHRGSAV